MNADTRDVALDLLMTAGETTRLLRCSRSTLYRRVADGTLPKPVRLGASVRWPRSEILDVIREAAKRRGT